MVNKTAALLVIGTIAAAGVAVAVSRAAPEGPAPSGELTLEIMEPPQAYDIGDVSGQAMVSALARLTGRANTGTPQPDMVMELYDNGTLRRTLTNPSVVLGQDYLLDETYTVADLGSHSVYGVMILTNSVDSVSYQTTPIDFEIGEAPTGEITIDVTPQ